MKMTPFVKAEYVGPPKRIGRFGAIITGCYVWLTRAEWTTVSQDKEAAKSWKHLEDTLENDPVEWPKMDDDVDAVEYEDNQAEPEPEAEVQEDDLGGGEVQEAEDTDGAEPEVDKRTTRAREEDGTFRADDPSTPDVDESQEQPADDEEVVPYEDCSSKELRAEIVRRNMDQGADITIPPRARKATLIALLEEDDQKD